MTPIDTPMPGVVLPVLVPVLPPVPVPAPVPTPTPVETVDHRTVEGRDRRLPGTTDHRGSGGVGAGTRRATDGSVHLRGTRSVGHRVISPRQP